ncbi:hypothetical protein WJX74_008724 [Apatococcus lobatus]|uniref:Expansin-like EG45 domain-containing protein n=1 Tax=Apatococcus lobatus TaxID=904363 RepID=A0AAW1RYL1_9CHLO
MRQMTAVSGDFSHLLQQTSLLLLSTAAVSGQLQSLPTDWRTGIATNYGGAQDGKDPSSPSFGTSIGSCGYGMLDKDAWPYWSVGALSQSNTFYSAGPIHGCGQCFEIQCVNTGGQFAGRCNGNGGESVTIMVSDACPECEPDHLDLQALTYNQLGPMALGRMDIKYRRVNCQPPVNMNVNIDSSSGLGGWIRMTVTNAAGRAAIKGVSLRGTGSSSWSEMLHDWGARWETGNQPGSAPFDMQVTQDDGQVVICNGCLQEGTGNFPTSMQFKIVGSADSADVVPADGASLSSSHSASSTASSPSPGGCPNCPDTPPDTTWTCAQQKSFGKCNEAWMGGYCNWKRLPPSAYSGQSARVREATFELTSELGSGAVGMGEDVHDEIKQGLADPRLQDVLVERVLPSLGATCLAKLRATCCSMQDLLDCELSATVWQSVAEQLGIGQPTVLEHQQQQPANPEACTCCQQTHDDLLLQQSQQQQSRQQAKRLPYSKSDATTEVQADRHSSQPAQHQSLNSSTATARSPDAVHPSSVLVQQKLRHTAMLLHKMQQPGQVVRKPVQAQSLGASVSWSSCGRWVAADQSQPQSHLTIWDTLSNTYQEIEILPHGRFLTLTWLPASTWLLYVKAHTCGHEFTKQSIFCQRMQSGEKRELLDRPHRHWRGQHVPAIASTGHVMAYVHSVCVVLLELPGLKHCGTLSPAIPGRSNVAAMGFNPAATQLAVCWEGNALDQRSAAFCLDVFDVQTKSRVFAMPCGSNIEFAWAPTSSHLLISSKIGVVLLNMGTLDAQKLPIIANSWLSSSNRASRSLVWTAKGDFALVCGRATSQQFLPAMCFAIQLDGHIHDQFSCPRRAFTVDCVGVRLLPSNHFHQMCHAQMVDMSWDVGQAPPLMSRCARLAVTLPTTFRDPRQWRVTHTGLDSTGLINQVLHMPLPGVRSGFPFAWHPSQALTCVYAVAGKGHDLWLVDGRQHRSLQHWSGGIPEGLSSFCAAIINSD